MLAVANLLHPIPAELPDELTESLVTAHDVTIERIVSRGHTSTDGFWYDQARNEFVLLIQGRAELQFENTAEPLTLGPGDYVDIKAHVRHRVSWTDPHRDTVWLAVHY